MKTKNKWITLLLIAAIIWAVVNIIIMSSKLEKAKDTIQLQNVQISYHKDTIYSYQNKEGELVAKINSVEVDKSNLKKALDIAGIEIKDLKANDIKWRNLVSILEMKLEAAGQGTTTVIDTFKIIETDTVYFQKVNNWTNNYLSLYDMTIENKEFDFKYNYKTPIKLFTEETKNVTIVTASLPDPEARITSANSIIISKKKKWYEKGWVWGTAGLATGIFIAK